MKKYSKCGEVKPLSSFYRAGGNSRDGLRDDCISCNLAAKAERHRLNPGPARERTRKWQLANPERAAVNQKAFVNSGGKRLADRKSHREARVRDDDRAVRGDARGPGRLLFHLWSSTA